ncbi:MAG TPA: hypothetical protein PLM34_00025 [Lentimicrobium sp.]|nr:hypothetical protein [Lentimicrobium sp.]
MCTKRFDSVKWGRLLAIWVKACNDEQPIMFYNSLMDSLGIEDEQGLRELISMNKELFRPLSPIALDRYKTYYNENIDNFPPGLVGVGEDPIDAVNNLNIHCGFTSQFRRRPNEQKSPKEIIEMGVNYIEKKWELEVKYTEIRDRFWGNLIIPILALLVALLAVILQK